MFRGLIAGATLAATVATVPITDPRGYFDTRLSFASSGSVRLAWSYPMTGATIFSRAQRVNVG